MEWKKFCGMEYGKIVFHSIPSHALTLTTRPSMRYLTKDFQIFAVAGCFGNVDLVVTTSNTIKDCLVGPGCQPQVRPAKKPFHLYQQSAILLQRDAQVECLLAPLYNKMVHDNVESSWSGACVQSIASSLNVGP